MIDYYSKSNVESFSLDTITSLFDKKYGTYTSPKSDDNFDFISPNGDAALEISLVADKNEFEAYRYKKEKLRGKKISSKRIKGVKTDDNGNILMYSGCSIYIIIKLISERIAEKDRKARRRLASCPNCSVELCLCIVEGGLLDKHSFKLYLRNLNSFVFKRYFFITRSFLFVYDEATGFTGYER